MAGAVAAAYAAVCHRIGAIGVSGAARCVVIARPAVDGRPTAVCIGGAGRGCRIVALSCRDDPGRAAVISGAGAIDVVAAAVRVGAAEGGLAGGKIGRASCRERV